MLELNLILFYVQRRSCWVVVVIFVRWLAAWVRKSDGRVWTQKEKLIVHWKSSLRANSSCNHPTTGNGYTIYAIRVLTNYLLSAYLDPSIICQQHLLANWSGTMKMNKKPMPTLFTRDKTDCMLPFRWIYFILYEKTQNKIPACVMDPFE